MSQFLITYRAHIEERSALGIPPLPLNAKQTADVIELIKQPIAGEEQFVTDLLIHRVPPGVDEASYVKAAFLADIAKGSYTCDLISVERAIELLGTMLGGYNVAPLVALLEDEKMAALAATQLKKTLLVYDAFYDVESKAKAGNAHAQSVLQSWADAEWFLNREDLPQKMTVSAYFVKGETNTDDLSPAVDAWSRPDIPLHALAMHKNPREGLPKALEQLADVQAKGYPVAYVGDVVGTGSSRKSATNSVLWHMGDEIPFVPNKKAGGVCIGNNIAPIFFNTMEDSGALPIECNVEQINMGDVIDVYPFEGKIEKAGEVISTFKLKSNVLLDEARAGGRIPLIIGRGLTTKARESLGLAPSNVFRKPTAPADNGKGFTLAQKMVGKACGLTDGQGIRPGTYCEPQMSTVGSQDTTGPMTRDELKELANLGFSADLTLQTFCHTAAYPKPVDVDTHHTLPDFFETRGGVALRPGDGVIHSWMNRMLLPDQVGTGGDSHTRFPLGISFPAGSGLVAFAAALGSMPLDMPESVLVRFTGEMQPGITLRDLVNSIPYAAIQRGLLTVDKKGKKNIFNGKIIEIEGLPNLKVEQAFELSDATAERSAAGCTILLDEAPIKEYLTSNVTMLRWMISQGYQEVRTLERRAQKMEAWLKDPQLIRPDHNAVYAEVIEINMSEVTEPILACPNDPDDVKLLSDVQGTEIDEVFIGSCMTNIGHFRAAAKLLRGTPDQAAAKLWIAPPTKMDESQLKNEGYYSDFAGAGARTEMPGCSLCMGNQARVAPGATVVSTSTRNFPNRLGKGANVYLASAELAAIASLLGKLPAVSEYLDYVKALEGDQADTYRYLNFDQLPEYSQAANKAANT